MGTSTVLAEIESRFRSINAKLDLVRTDLQDLKIRMGAADERLAGVNRRLDGRLERIESRVTLRDQS